MTRTTSAWWCWILASVLVVGWLPSLAGVAGAQTLEAVDLGFYDWQGEHSPTLTNYACGNVAAAGYNEVRNFFVFDLSGVTGPFQSGRLEVYNPVSPPDAGNGYRSADPSETYVLYQVATPVATLVAGGSGLTEIFDDLGGGVIFGSVEVSAADNGQLVTVELTPEAVADVNLAVGGLWAVGGTLTTMVGTRIELIFAYSNGSAIQRLVLEGGSAIFADGFESGGTSSWSSVTP